MGLEGVEMDCTMMIGRQKTNLKKRKGIFEKLIWRIRILFYQL